MPENIQAFEEATGLKANTCISEYILYLIYLKTYYVNFNIAQNAQLLQEVQKSIEDIKHLKELKKKL